MRRHALLISALALAIAQIAFLSWIIVGRAGVLRGGAEVVFRIKPVDPRDLLRGDYVTLNYEISNIPVKLIGNAPAGQFETQAGSIFVRVARGEDGYWHAVSASLQDRPQTSPAAGEIDLRGQTFAGRSLGPETAIDVDYGIERFYLPEGEGRAIEQDMNVRPFGVKVAVADDGTARIKALLDGDVTLFEEPLY